MNEIKNNGKKWFYWFMLGVCIIIVYIVIEQSKLSSTIIKIQMYSITIYFLHIVQYYKHISNYI